MTCCVLRISNLFLIPKMRMRQFVFYYIFEIPARKVQSPNPSKII